MPTTNDEARLRLKGLLEAKERSMAWLARKLDEDRMWVTNRLNGKVGIQLEDYARMLTILDPDARELAD
ncbi:MAG: hypothetical protein ACTHYD_04895 [Canibacter sp.]